MSVVVVAAAVAAGLAAWLSMSPPVRRGPLSRVRPRPDLLAGWRRRGPRGSQARAIGALTAALASELRSGQTPDQAWDVVLCGWAGAIPGRFVPGADVVTVLTRWARTPGWGGLDAVAVCWRVADTTGAGLADALDRIGDAMRHEHEVTAEVDGQLASVRATASVLATLPAVAVVMGHLLGAEPIRVLLTTSVGAGCLAVGVMLAGTGWWWLTRQVEVVRRSLRW